MREVRQLRKVSADVALIDFAQFPPFPHGNQKTTGDSSATDEAGAHPFWS